jgi:hypothetical protein
MKILYVFVVLAIAISSAYGQTTLRGDQCMSDDAQMNRIQITNQATLAANVGDSRKACELIQQVIFQMESCKPLHKTKYYEEILSSLYSNAKKACNCAKTNAC